MSERAAPLVRRPRLNPFAFPSETTLRFILLVIFVLCGSAWLYGEFPEQDPAGKQCTSQALAETSKLTASSEADSVRSAAMASRELAPVLARCATFLRPKIMWQIGGMGLVIVVAATFYCLYPAWKLRTGRFEPISSSELPEIERELQSIVETARLPDAPAFVWNPLATDLPVVFGRRGRYHVALSGGFVTRYFYRDKGAFRAVMLHELAHIDNGDVAKTYLTLSLWWAFLAAALAPASVIFSGAWRPCAGRMRLCCCLKASCGSVSSFCPAWRSCVRASTTPMCAPRSGIGPPRSTVGSPTCPPPTARAGAAISGSIRIPGNAGKSSKTRQGCSD